MKTGRSQEALEHYVTYLYGQPQAEDEYRTEAIRFIGQHAGLALSESDFQD